MARSALGLNVIPIFMLALTLLFLFLSFLGGYNSKRPLNEVFYLEADIGQNDVLSTENLPQSDTGAYRWTPWSICGVNNAGKNAFCTGSNAAQTFEPLQYFDTTSIPDSNGFRNHNNLYENGTRAVWAFFILAIAATGITFLLSLISLCSRIGSGIASVLSLVALLFTIVLAALLTSIFINIRDDFRDLGVPSHLNVKMLGFVWAAVATLMIATFMFGITCCCARDRKTYNTETKPRRGFFGKGRQNGTSTGRNVHTTHV